MPPWQQGHLPPTLPTLLILQMFSMLVCNCNFSTMNYCKHCHQNCFITSYCISSSCSISFSVSAQLCHQFNDTPLQTFMISSFYFKAFSRSRMLMFISLGAWCRAQPAVSSMCSRDTHYYCHQGAQVHKTCQVPARPGGFGAACTKDSQFGSADFCDIRLVSFCPK